MHTTFYSFMVSILLCVSFATICSQEPLLSEEQYEAIFRIEKQWTDSARAREAYQNASQRIDHAKSVLNCFAGNSFYTIANSSDVPLKWILTENCSLICTYFNWLEPFKQSVLRVCDVHKKDSLNKLSELTAAHKFMEQCIAQAQIFAKQEIARGKKEVDETKLLLTSLWPLGNWWQKCDDVIYADDLYNQAVKVKGLLNVTHFNQGHAGLKTFLQGIKLAPEIDIDNFSWFTTLIEAVKYELEQPEKNDKNYLDMESYCMATQCHTEKMVQLTSLKKHRDAHAPRYIWIFPKSIAELQEQYCQWIRQCVLDQEQSIQNWQEAQKNIKELREQLKLEEIVAAVFKQRALQMMLGNDNNLVLNSGPIVKKPLLLAAKVQNPTSIHSNSLGFDSLSEQEEREEKKNNEDSESDSEQKKYEEEGNEGSGPVTLVLDAPKMVLKQLNRLPKNQYLNPQDNHTKNLLTIAIAQLCDRQSVPDIYQFLTATSAKTQDGHYKAMLSALHRGSLRTVLKDQRYVCQDTKKLQEAIRLTRVDGENQSDDEA